MADKFSIAGSGSSANRVDIVFVAEGYTAAERAKFVTDATNFSNYILSATNSRVTDPFYTYRSLINTSGLFVESQQSGISNSTTTLNTAFSAKSYLSDNRLVYGNSSAVQSAVNSAFAANAHEIIIVLVNSSAYGGAGGSVAWATSSNVNSYEIALHEIGHSFAGLQDEYVDPAIASSYPLSAIANSAHVSTSSDPAVVAWKDWIGFQDSLGTVGVYEGGYYRSTGVWRATVRSKMLYLGDAFSAPEKEAFINRFYQSIGSYASLSMNSLVEVLAQTPQNSLFRFDWTLSGQAYPNSNYNLMLDSYIRAQANGRVTVNVSLDVSDATVLVRKASVLAESLEHLSLTASLVKVAMGSAETQYTASLADNYFIIGSAGDDTIRTAGLAANMSYVEGGVGNDRIAGNAGNDILDGGADEDTALYEGATAGVTVSLAVTGVQNTTGAGWDTLIGMENLSGSALDDLLIGNISANKLFGNGGNDTLTGGLGNDSLDGGSETDTALFSGNRSGYTITNNNNGTWSIVGADGSDTLSNIEFAQFADQTVSLVSNSGLVLTGDGNPNTLTGGVNNDTISGLGGNDILNGMGGADSLDGGDGNDTITFDALDTLVQGGAGSADIGIFSGASQAQARAYDLVAHGFETLQWVLNGNTYTIVPSSGGTRIESVTDTALSEAGFAQRTTTLDSLAREELVNMLRDDGSRFIYDYDPANAAAWTSILQVFAAGATLDYTDTSYDNGARIVRDEDQGNLNGWTSITTTYASGGAVDYQDNVYDDGARVIFDGDQAAAFDWTSISTTYAAGGAVDYQDYIYDNGRRVIFDSDQTNAAAWTQRSTSYAPGNALDVQDTTFDDNTRQIYDWDQGDASAVWDIWETFYNNAGTAISQRITYDTGQVVVFNL